MTYHGPMKALLLGAFVLSMGCGPRAEPSVATGSADAGVVPVETIAPPPALDAGATSDAAPPAADASKPPPMDEAGCPKTFVAGVSNHCVLAMPGKQTTCKYPEGTCDCVEPAQCGGAYMAHPPGSPGVLVCAPKDPAALKADGCPWKTPTDKSPCKAAQTCSYGDCSYSQTVATCKGGKWKVEHLESPPPP